MESEALLSTARDTSQEQSNFMTSLLAMLSWTNNMQNTGEHIYNPEFNIYNDSVLE